RRGKQRLDLVAVEIRNRTAVMAFAWDCEDALTKENVGRLTQCYESKERVNGRKTDVSGARSVAALGLEMVEELANEGRGEVVNRELARRSPKPLHRRRKQSR